MGLPRGDSQADLLLIIAVVPPEDRRVSRPPAHGLAWHLAPRNSMAFNADEEVDAVARSILYGVERAGRSVHLVRLRRETDLVDDNSSVMYIVTVERRALTILVSRHSYKVRDTMRARARVCVCE